MKVQRSPPPANRATQRTAIQSQSKTMFQKAKRTKVGETNSPIKKQKKTKILLTLEVKTQNREVHFYSPLQFNWCPFGTRQRKLTKDSVHQKSATSQPDVNVRHENHRPTNSLRSRTQVADRVMASFDDSEHTTLSIAAYHQGDEKIPVGTPVLREMKIYSWTVRIC